MYTSLCEWSPGLWSIPTPTDVDADFQSLAKSQEEKNPALKKSIKQSSTLLSATFKKEEVFLDVPEEVEHTVNKMINLLDQTIWLPNTWNLEVKPSSSG